MSKLPKKLEYEFAYKREVFESWTDEEIWEEIFDLENTGNYGWDRTLEKQIRQHAISVGFYCSTTNEELSRTWNSSGKKKYDFKMDGIKYVCNDHFGRYLRQLSRTKWRGTK